MVDIESTPEFVSGVYEKMEAALQALRGRLDRPMGLADKLLLSHLDDTSAESLEPGSSYLMLRPDRVALQDVLGQTVMLQFMQTRRKTTAVPTTVHCDHLIQARSEGGIDLLQSVEENSEVYDFLKSAAAKYGAGFWAPGAGIIHQVILEEYAFPGALIIGTDSHTPNAGGLGACAVGVGGADAVEVMAGPPLGGPVPAPCRRSADRRDERLDGSQGRDPVPGGRADCLRRHQLDHRVLRAGHALHKLHGQGHHNQHGRRAWRYDLRLPLRRAHGALSPRDVGGATWRTWRTSTRASCRRTMTWRRTQRATSTAWWR